MSDRVARLSALRRNRKNKLDLSTTAGAETHTNKDIGDSQTVDQLKSTSTPIADPIDTTVTDSNQIHPVEEDLTKQEEPITVAETLSYNDDLKQDISDLLSKSERATDKALKQIIREKFQQLQEGEK